MKELSDKELDELFRKSAEEFEPTYEASDWNDLRRRLDEADGVTGGGWLKSAAPWLAGVLLLLLGGAGAYFYSTEENGSPVDRIEKVSSAPKISTSDRTATESGTEVARTQAGSSPDLARSDRENKIVSPEPGKSGSDDPGSRGAENRIRKPNREVEKVASANTPTASKGIKELPRNPASVSGVRKPTDPDGKRGEGAILLSKKTSTPKVRKSADDLAKKSAPTDGESPLFQRQKESVGTPATSEQKSSSDNAVGSSREKPADILLRNEWPGLSKLSAKAAPRENDRLSYPVVAYKTNKDSDTVAPEKVAADVPLWSVRIGIAPDLSTVRISEMMNTVRPGPSASLLVDFNLNDKFALQTGIIRSLKSYNAQFDDYNGAEEWGNDPMPASVDSDCQVFELPVNLRYDFGYNLSPRQKARWFLGVGVSSYKMQTEKYTYNYPKNSPDQRAPKDMAKGTGWYLLSHANVSVGYEHRLTRRLSIVAEPYLKVPLRGVGWGKVNLFSTGIWFSARYTPVFRK